VDSAKISDFFPNLTVQQQEQFAQLGELYADWNAKINVISRKDMDQFVERHVLHSLGIALTMPFLPNARVLDVGTGGGFPGIPLAILFPQTHFHLVDSIGKKIKVVNAIKKALHLKNVKADQMRAETINHQYDFVVSRAVTRMPAFVSWVKTKIRKGNVHALKNGILYLKGGDLTEELNETRAAHKGIKHLQEYPLSNHFKTEFFETKKVVYLSF